VTWTGPEQLKAQLTRLWQRGELLRDAVTGETHFPLRLTLKSPSSSDITDRFDAVRAWAAELAALTSVRLEWRELRHRVQGTQTIPVRAWVDTLEDALKWLGKSLAWQRFSSLVASARQTQPCLLPWLEKRPLQALELYAEWPLLLAVVARLMAQPRPGLYLRQLDLPGLHSKFIEAHRGVLAELFDLALPAEAVDTNKTGVSQFAARYGFREKPNRIRMRTLDPGLTPQLGLIGADLTLDSDSFSQLELSVGRVFITENEINFLAFPNVPGAIVIFGAGYGWDALARSQWLQRCKIHYWGDIDTHGFGILDQLRSHFAHVHSFLMDRQTLTAHSQFWGSEAQPLLTELRRLTPEERSLYIDLRDDRIGVGLRLEQERIGFDWLNARLQELLG